MDQWNLPETESQKQERLKTGLMTLNMGPQHPATHGVLRVEIKTDSEVVAQATPHLGYLHRCMEKHAEAVEYRGVIPFMDRLDYLASMSMEWTYVDAVEKMIGTEVPVRAEYIRTIVAELQRVASHLVAFGTYAIDLGAFSPFLYAFDEREKILRLFEELSGARLLYNYIWVGGVWNDITDAQLKMVQEFIDHMGPETEKYYSLVSVNKIFVERTTNIGILTPEDCFAYGATGPVLRGSGVKWDLRKVQPYSLYDKFDFDVPVGDGERGVVGDCWNRYIVRMREVKESLKIVQQCLDGIEAGPFMGKVPKVLKLPEGEIFSKMECPKGELGVHMVSSGKGKTPYRLKIKSPCFSHVAMLPHLGKGQMIADFVASIGSIDIVLGEVDR
jgi:NADH-quinone oxidoreductase subunit D